MYTFYRCVSGRVSAAVYFFGKLTLDAVFPECIPEAVRTGNGFRRHRAALNYQRKKELPQTGFGDFCLRQPVIYSSNSLNSGSTVFFILA